MQVVEVDSEDGMSLTRDMPRDNGMKTEKEWDSQHCLLLHGLVCNVVGVQYPRSEASATNCKHCGPRPSDKDTEIAELRAEIERLRDGINTMIDAVELTINPPPPSPNSIPISNFGSAGAYIVGDAWMEWAKEKKAFLLGLLTGVKS